MKTSTKLIVTGAASLLGVALAVGGASAATGSLSVANAPGHVLQVGGVVPASALVTQHATEHATTPATTHATTRATTQATTRARTQATTGATTCATGMPCGGVSQVAPPPAQSVPMHHAEVPSSGPAHSGPGMHMSGH
jgi:hypothetical protein